LEDVGVYLGGSNNKDKTRVTILYIYILIITKKDHNILRINNNVLY